MQFTKLFNSILDSTIWQEAKETKIVWITMLAMCDRYGDVFASIPGLASRAKVSVPECEHAILCLMSPDPYSRTKDHEGRRIKEIDGGWQLLNHGKYRELLSTAERREYLRLKQQESRAKKRQQSVNNCQQKSTQSTHTEANQKQIREKKEETAPFPDDLPTEYREQLNLWWKHKIERGSTYKPTGWKILVNRERQKPIQELKRDIEHSIGNNYLGIFSPKENGTTTTATNGTHQRRPLPGQFL